MQVRRFFLVFFISLLLFIMFLFMVFYNFFIKEIKEEEEFYQSKYLSNYLNAIYISAKYDLQNIIRDTSYLPLFPVFIYNKKDDNLVKFDGGDVDRDIKDFVSRNINNIVYTEDNFGYLPPFLQQGKLKAFIKAFIMVERGDNIYISAISADISSIGLEVCIKSLEQFKSKSNVECNSSQSDFKRLMDMKAYEYKYRLKKNSYNFLIIMIIITILVAGIFSLWVSRHFDLEERSLINEIENAIGDVSTGRIHRLSIKSIYKPYSKIINAINKLITELSAQVDKYKVVYNDHFKSEEKGKSVSESYSVIIDYLTDQDNNSTDIYNIFKALDLLLSNNRGGLKYVGKPELNDSFRLMILIILDLVRSGKAFKLILEFSAQHIDIKSENEDFSQGDIKFASLIQQDRIEIGNRKIVIII